MFWVFCLMLYVKLHLCMIHRDKTFPWGKQGEGPLCWKLLTNGQV